MAARATPLNAMLERPQPRGFEHDRMETHANGVSHECLNAEIEAIARRY